MGGKSPKVQEQPAPIVLPMPDPEQTGKDKKRVFDTLRARTGRESTMLTQQQNQNGTGGKLGA